MRSDVPHATYFTHTFKIMKLDLEIMVEYLASLSPSSAAAPASSSPRENKLNALFFAVRRSYLRFSARAALSASAMPSLA